MSSKKEESMFDFDTLKDHFGDKFDVYYDEENLEIGGLYMLYIAKPFSQRGREYQIAVYKGKEKDNSNNTVYKDAELKKRMPYKLKFDYLFSLYEFDKYGKSPNIMGFEANQPGVTHYHGKNQFYKRVRKDDPNSPDEVSIYDFNEGADKINRDYKDSANQFVKKVIEKGYDDARTVTPEYDEVDEEDWAMLHNDDEKDSEKEKRLDEMRTVFENIGKGEKGGRRPRKTKKTAGKRRVKKSRKTKARRTRKSHKK
jgi:hypothetical protein